MKVIAVTSLKEKVILNALMGLILWFFAIPLVAYFFFECKPYVPKKIASVLLFFFR
jgi:hypothetical protein